MVRVRVRVKIRTRVSVRWHLKLKGYSWDYGEVNGYDLG